MESGDKECHQQNVQVGIDQKTFHFINVFVLKTCKTTTTTTDKILQQLQLQQVSHLVICPTAIAYSMGQIIKWVCVCPSVSVSVCEHSHCRISWSIFTKIGRDVKTSVVTDSESATESADSSRVRPSPNPRIFCGRKWRFWVVCLRVNIYLSGDGVQVTCVAASAAVWEIEWMRRRRSPSRCLVGHVTHLAASNNYLKR